MKNDGQKPATQQDLAKLKQELLEAQGRLKDELQEAIHDSETNLLKAIYAYAEAAQRHFADLDRSDGSL